MIGQGLIDSWSQLGCEKLWIIGLVNKNLIVHTGRAERGINY
jgi:hypothetical protein